MATKKKKRVPKKRVVARKSIIKRQMEGYKKVMDFPVPELKEDGKEDIPIFKVKSATLDDQIKAQYLSLEPNRLTLRILRMLKDGDGEKIDTVEFRKQLFFDDLHPQTIQVCEIFQRCVLEPKFTMGEVLEMSKTHPELVNNVATFALTMNIKEKEDGDNR
jgi:hypothetical protein